jgi:carboxymethylenebutenolidase
MAIDSSWFAYDSQGQAIPALRARPISDTPAPGVVLIQEVWGVDAHIEDVAGRLADAGYSVIAPDLWGVGGERPKALVRERVQAVKAFVATHPAVWGGGETREHALATVPEPQRKELRETMASLFLPEAGRAERFERYTRIVRDAVAVSPTPVGIVGFCMGGGVAGLASCAPGPSATVVFYGAPPPLDRVPDIACPILGHYADPDPRVTPKVPAFADAMRASGKSFEYHVYKAPHAFFNDTTAAYRAEAAQTAWSRTLAFLRQHLIAG